MTDIMKNRYLYNGALGDTICLAMCARMSFTDSELKNITFIVNYPEVFNNLCNAKHLKSIHSKNSVSSSTTKTMMNSTNYKIIRDIYWYLKSFLGLRYTYISWYRTFRLRSVPLTNIFLSILSKSEIKSSFCSRWLKKNQNEGKRVIISAEAGWTCRQPNISSILNLIKYLNLKSSDIDIVGLKKSNDELSKYNDLRGKLSLKELMEHVSKSSLTITADSALYHLAILYDIPTISFFGPVKPELRAYPSDKCTFLIRKDLDCLGCSINHDISKTNGECPLGHNECMKFDSENIKMELKNVRLHW